jgi:hypothetical protein
MNLVAFHPASPAAAVFSGELAMSSSPQSLHEFSPETQQQQQFEKHEEGKSAEMGSPENENGLSKGQQNTVSQLPMNTADSTATNVDSESSSTVLATEQEQLPEDLSRLNVVETTSNVAESNTEEVQDHPVVPSESPADNGAEKSGDSVGRTKQRSSGVNDQDRTSDLIRKQINEIEREITRCIQNNNVKKVRLYILTYAHTTIAIITSQ